MLIINVSKISVKSESLGETETLAKNIVGVEVLLLDHLEKVLDDHSLLH